jgi:hypothetical protein
MTSFVYYVYAYIRSKPSKNGRFPAGTPYYIGKGKGDRITKRHNVPVPKDSRYIVIMESNLSELGALALERQYIKWYGRIDLGTGFLRNLTDGGEGTSGWIPSTETREKMARLAKGRSQSTETREKIARASKGRESKLKGRKQTDEHKEKVSASLKGRKQTDEHKEKRSISMRGNTNWKNGWAKTQFKKGHSNPPPIKYTYTICSPTGEIFETKSLNKFCIQHMLNRYVLMEYMNKDVIPPVSSSNRRPGRYRKETTGWKISSILL